MKDFRIGLVQMASRPGEIGWNVDRIAALAADASTRGAEIVCFPELAATGYGQGASIRGWAESIPGPITQQLTDIARTSGATLLVGMLESTADTVLNAQVIVAPDGMVGRYQKTHVPDWERPAFDAGDRVLTFDHPKARFGIQVCYDTHFPELSAAMAAAGAEVLFMPHASAGPEGRDEKLERWMRYFPARAYDNGVFVAVCNAAGKTADGETSPGLAFVLDPLGRVIAASRGDGDETLIVDLEAAVLEETRESPFSDFRRFRRPTLYGAGEPR